MLVESEAFNPPSETVKLIQQVAEAIQPDDQRFQDWFRGYVKDHKERIASDLEIVKNNTNTQQKILEYGAIPLLTTVALKEIGYEVRALDIAPERFSTSIQQQALQVVKCDVEKEITPFEDATFDVVIFNEIFEHLRINPIFTLQEVHRVLKPQGTLLLSTPNLRSLIGIRNFLFKNLGYSCSADPYVEYQKLEKLGHMGHVREYTVREVSDFLGRIGFLVQKVIFRGRFYTNTEQVLVRMWPNLRPFFSVVACKTSSS